jgi:very-short-patch-repair endonuclease
VEVTIRRGIPVTTPARTIADLSSVRSRSTGNAAELRRAIRQAAALGLDIGGTDHDGTRSDLEARFLELCRSARLPTPEVNVTLAGIEVDFLWRAAKLVVETDGYRYHRGNDAFERDRARDLALQALGFRVIRLSYRQVTEFGPEVVAALRPRLGG